MTDALILFVRNPEAGKVKTRIAAVAGDAMALHIYERLLQHTHAITSSVAADKFVYYADAINQKDRWSIGHYIKAIQEGPDLGARMYQAFNDIFKQGYEKVCIIGSDCYELTSSIIEQAFTKLNHTDIVIGPATDGGYYLLGMKNGVKNLFAGIEWSTSNVLQQTLQHIEQQHCTYSLIPELTDIDTVNDIPEAWK